MGNLFESLKDYFENTPKDVIEKDWREIEYLNEIGPDVIEYAEFVRENFGTAVSIPTPRKKNVYVRAQLVWHLTPNNGAKVLPPVASCGFINANMKKIYRVGQK